MKTTQHTPGPWFTRGDTLDNIGSAIEIEAELPSAGLTTLATVYDRALNCAHLPDGPNARLMAAAPDLLEATKALIYLVNQHARFIGEGDRTHVALKRAEATITKAEEG